MAAAGVDTDVQLDPHVDAEPVDLYVADADRDVELDELVEEEYEIFNPSAPVRRAITCLDEPPLPAPIAVELAHDEQQFVFMLDTDEAIMTDANLERFQHLHDANHPDAPPRSRERPRRRRRTARGGGGGSGNGDNGRGSAPAGSGSRLDAAAKRTSRSRNVMSALATHVLERDKDSSEANRQEYEAVAIKSRSEAQSVGVQWLPQRITTFIIRKRRGMNGVRQSIYMMPGDWLIIRNVNSGEDERAQVKTFQPFRRYKSQRVADTAYVDVSRVSNV